MTDKPAPTLREACELGFIRLDAIAEALAIYSGSGFIDDLCRQVSDLRDVFDAALTADEGELPALAAILAAAQSTWSALDEQRSRDARVMSPKLRQAQDALGAAVRKARGEDE